LGRRVELEQGNRAAKGQRRKGVCGLAAADLFGGRCGGARAWGKNDPFFLPPRAEAFKRDIPDADVRFFDTGHFALETHCDEIAAAIRNFLSRSK
jgi:pimeloyl-ACP methyl ester carboxylesterase